MQTYLSAGLVPWQYLLSAFDLNTLNIPIAFSSPENNFSLRPTLMISKHKRQTTTVQLYLL